MTDCQDAGHLYHDFLSRNANFLRQHLSHYPPEAFTNVEWAVNRVKMLGSPFNYFLFAKQTDSSITSPSQDPFTQDKKIIGVCGGFGIQSAQDQVETIEVGYALDEASCSKGIVSNTLRFVCELVFREAPSVQSIKIVCNSNNVKSMAVANRLGFEFNEKLTRETSEREKVNLNVYLLPRCHVIQ